MANITLNFSEENGETISGENGDRSSQKVEGHENAK